VAVNTHFLAELFVVACAESGHRCAVDTLELAPGVVVVEDVICWILSIYPFAIAAFYCVNAIVLTIK
jgi:hypothetical protein